jgi:transcriptional regulator with XRE-family HTH domain
MKRDTSAEFGTYLKDLRLKRNLSTRELARKSGLDPAGILRIERGTQQAQTGTLKKLALALEVPAGDVLAAAGLLAPADLPDMSTYLRICHGNLSDETVASIDQYIQRLVNEEGLEPNGPELLEDEAEQLSRD